MGDMRNCCFCKEKCGGELVLIDENISLKDGSDMVVCSTCLNFYAHHEYGKLEKRVEGLK